MEGDKLVQEAIDRYPVGCVITLLNGMGGRVSENTTFLWDEITKEVYVGNHAVYFLGVGNWMPACFLPVNKEEIKNDYSLF